MKNPPFEDVHPIEDGDFQCRVSCWGCNTFIGPFYIDFYMANHEIGIFTTGNSWKSLQMIHPSFNVAHFWFFSTTHRTFWGKIGAESSRQSFGLESNQSKHPICWHPCRGVSWIPQDAIAQDAIRLNLHFPPRILGGASCPFQDKTLNWKFPNVRKT